MTIKTLEPGTRVRVTQTIHRREGDWETSISGEVVEHRQAKTGSWYAHGKHGKLWLERLTIRKDNGELSTLTLDDRTHIEILNSIASG